MPAARRPIRPRRRAANAQSLVEFALLSPVVILLIFGGIDISRAVYTYNAIRDATREGSRLVALRPQISSDCDPLARMKTVGQAFTLTQDPNSINDTTKNTDPNTSTPPNGPSTPARGQGYMYIYPAVASGTTGNTCDNPSVNRAKDANGTVSVEISYSFTPITPMITGIFGNIVLHSTSVVAAGY